MSQTFFPHALVDSRHRQPLKKLFFPRISQRAKDSGPGQELSPPNRDITYEKKPVINKFLDKLKSQKTMHHASDELLLNRYKQFKKPAQLSKEVFSGQINRYLVTQLSLQSSANRDSGAGQGNRDSGASSLMGQCLDEVRNAGSNDEEKAEKGKRATRPVLNSSRNEQSPEEAQQSERSRFVKKAQMNQNYSVLQYLQETQKQKEIENNLL